MTVMLRTTRRAWAAITALAWLSCLVSCEIPPTETMPRLSDLRSPTQPGEANEPAPTADTPVIALIHRIDLPLQVSLDPLWETVDEQALPLRMHGMWQANGLRIGVLSSQRAQAFADALPPIQGESRAKLLGSPYYSAIRSAPRLREPIIIDLTDPPMSPRVVRAQGGRLQLLAKIGRDNHGQPYLELTPHHYKPKTTLLPRSPLEKQLDGQVYDTLTAHITLPHDRAVIVGLYRPWPQAEETEDSSSDTAEGVDDAVDSEQIPDDNADAKNESIDPAVSSDQPPAITDQQSSPKPPTIPDHLGKALMAGTRAGKPMQIILVISIIEDQRPTTGNDPR